MSTFPSDKSLLAIGGLTLVAPSLKIMYTPTPKVACSTIKLMLATAEGTHRTDLIDRITSANVSRQQTIHNPAVNGLPRLVDLRRREIDNIFSSPDWVRVAALRDPIARAYSAWENRIFLRPPGVTERAVELAHDVIVDGRIDLAASFALFTQMLAGQGEVFMNDHHFLPQTHIVRTDAINYDMLIRTDRKGDLDRLAEVISERSGKSIQPLRLNEGMRIDLTKLCDAGTANLLAAIYHTDYEAFGFDRREFAPTVEPFLLSQSETRLVLQTRAVMERLLSLSRASARQAGGWYGVRQIQRAILRRLSGRRLYSDYRLLDA